MPSVTSSSAELAGQAAVTDYDSFAEQYSALNEVSLLNAYYERPATLALAGDVTGRLIASVDHPLQGHPLVRPGADYWATYQYSVEATAPSGQSFVLTYWHRPLPAMISAFTTAGFRIAAIGEPLPAPDTPRELLPDFRKDNPQGSGFLCFMFFVLEAC